jgi:hypothetical protein
MSKYSNKEKAEAARREVGLRRHVYARRVAEGKMREELAREQIALMEEIAEDYERLDKQDRPQLF